MIEHLARRVLQDVPVLLAYVDSEHRYRFASEGYRAWFGLDPESLIGRHLSDVVGAAAYASLLPRLETVFRGETVRFESELEYESGSRWVDAVYTPHVQEGVVVGFSAVVQDVSERRRIDAERAELLRRERAALEEVRRNAAILRFLADAGAALGSSLDIDATFEAVTRLAVPHMADWASIDMLGEGGVIRRVAVAHVDPTKVAFAHELHAKWPKPTLDDPNGVGRVLRTGEPEITLEIPDELLVAAIPDPEMLRIIRELGLSSVLCLPLRARGQTVGALSLIAAESKRRFSEADIVVATEVARRAGTAIEHAQVHREAQEANRLKDEFLGTVSHELRTPLNAILGWVTLLRGKKAGDPAALARGLETIDRNARAQARLIEDVLDVSRIISGKLQLHREPCDLATVVQAALDVVGPMAAAKGVSLGAELEPGITILGDADRLQQVAWNLLSNAVKFTPAGGHVRAQLVPGPTGAVLRVEDDGMGIPPDLRAFVFDRFRQADSSPSRRHGGLGLGLAIARHIVELHGGTIEVASEGEGRGAVFSVHIPRPGSDHPPARAPAAEGASAAGQPLSGIRALVIDDDPDARELMTITLTGAGADVRSAADAAEAMALVVSFAPQVLVSDIGLPGEDGYSLLRRVRARGPAGGGDVPAVAITAYAGAADARRAAEAGFQRHLPKPIQEALLLETVAELIAR